MIKIGHALFLVFLTLSCTTVHFRSLNKIPVTFLGNPNHQKEVTIQVRRNFHVWGLSPDHHEVLIDEEILSQGHRELSKLIIYEERDFSDILVSFLTFGFFVPRTYVITGYVPEFQEKIFD